MYLVDLAGSERAESTGYLPLSFVAPRFLSLSTCLLLSISLSLSRSLTLADALCRWL